MKLSISKKNKVLLIFVSKKIVNIEFILYLHDEKEENYNLM